MNIITSINAKDGCGKSTIAMNIAAGLAHAGYATLLIDMDPQAQITQWLHLGDGLSDEGTLVQALGGVRSLVELIQPSTFANLAFIASAEGLEELGRQITDRADYATLLTRGLATVADRFKFVVIDSPNQISPVMANAIYSTDLFVVPFESTKAVRSYANFYQLLMTLRPGEAHRLLHVVSNLTRQPGLHKRVLAAMQSQAIQPAASEVRTCGWLAQVDEHGGSIFDWRPHSRGAADLRRLVNEVLAVLGLPEALPGSASPLLEQRTLPHSPAQMASLATSADEVPAPGNYALHDGELIPQPTASSAAAPDAPAHDGQPLIHNPSQHS